jgi:hypothetical protein
MIAHTLAIGIPAAVFLSGCAAIARRKHRDEDTTPFNWQGTVPAAPGQCSCGAPHARKLPPFPGDPAPVPAVTVIPARTTPGYVTDALDGHDNADDFLASAWKKIDGLRLAEQIRDGSL